MSGERYVYDFDEEAPGGRELLGGKGVGLAEMTALGIPVPGGFTVTTDACRAYMRAGKEVPAGLDAEVQRHLEALEQKSGKRFGDAHDPLLVSVRSGAAVSMPGMMDSILNLGLNDEAVAGLAKSTGNARFANDSYRRLIQMYGEVVDGVDPRALRGRAHRAEARAGRRAGCRADRRGHARAGRDVQGDLRAGHRTGLPAGPGRAARPRDPRGLRLLGHAARAGLPARERDLGRHRHGGQRRRDGVREHGRRSATGVCFSRNPSTGEARLYGEYLAMRRARTSLPASARRSRSTGMADVLPDAFRRAPGHGAPARGALPRHAGHRVHGRGGPALSPADAHREAHGRGRAEVRPSTWSTRA